MPLVASKLRDHGIGPCTEARSALIGALDCNGGVGRERQHLPVRPAPPMVCHGGVSQQSYT
eukprot:scaffold3019_cov69-Phaeocystis_antarctica.AAC.3